MTPLPLQALVIETIRAPKEAADRLLALNLPRQWLWMALALMCILNAIVHSISLRINPPPADLLAAMPPVMQSPMLFTLFLFGGLVISVFVLHWVGQALDGQGSLTDILVLLTWLQVMRLVFQLVVLILGLLSPALAGLFVLVAMLYSIYIVSAFVDRAHRYDNLLKAFCVIALSLLGMVAGLSMIIALIGAAILGGTGNV